MPSEFPGSPRRLKGALAVYESDARGTQPQIIVFQYNPNQVRRTLASRAAFDPFHFDVNLDEEKEPDAGKESREADGGKRDGNTKD
jgi:hypothetical protein